MVNLPSSPQLAPDDSATHSFLAMRHTVWFFFIAMIIGGIGGALLWDGVQTGLGLETLPSGVSNLVMLMGIQIGMAGFAWLTLKRAGVQIGQIVGPFPPQYNWVGGLGWAIALMIFTFSFMATVAYGAVSLFPEAIADRMIPLFTALAQERNPFWVDVGMALLGSIVAPLSEEFTFRGLFLHCWSVHRSIRIGLILTALLFAMLHPQNFVGMFVFSLVLSLLYLRTRSLWVPIGVHALYNGIIFGGNLISLAANNGAGVPGSVSPEAFAEATVNEAIASISQARFGITAGVFLLLAGFFVVRFLYKNWPGTTTQLPYIHNLSISQES